MLVGVMVPKPGPSAIEWTSLAASYERADFDFVALPDHYGQGPAPIPALAAIGSATSQIGLVPLTLNCGKREFGQLVDDVATLSAAFGDRVRVGLGVGWHRRDWSAHGATMAPFGERLTSMEHFASRVRKGLSSAATYSNPEVGLNPKIIIGGAGTRLLTSAAQFADVVGIGPDLARGSFDSISVEQTSREATIGRCDLVAQSAPSAANVPIQILVLQLVLCREAKDGYDEIARTYSTTVELVTRSPHFLAGSPDQIRTKLEYWAEHHHVDEIVVNQVDLEHPADQLAEFVGTLRHG